MPREFLIYKDNELVFLDSDMNDDSSNSSGFSLSRLMKNYQGPVFFYSLNFIRDRAIKMKKALKKVRLFYALKANAHPEVLKVLKGQGIGVDVVSGGEIRQAIKNGFSYQSLVYSGVGKTKNELRLAIQNDIYQINVESIPELQRVAEIAKELEKKASVAFRINPDISIKTHPYIATGLQDNKFGIDTSQLGEVIGKVKEHSNYLSVKGVSLHLGSQMMEFASLKDSLVKLKPLFLDLYNLFPDCHRFDIGGGLGIFYEKQDLDLEESLLNDYAQTIFSELDQLKTLVPNLEIQSEPGRWLVGHGGVLVCQVQYVKKTPHKEFVILDSGMNHLLRPSLYQAYHGIHSLRRENNSVEKNYDVVGPICESADFFCKDRLLTEVKADDFLVIRDCGAYGASMSSDYNLQDRAFEMTEKTFVSK